MEFSRFPTAEHSRQPTPNPLSQPLEVLQKIEDRSSSRHRCMWYERYTVAHKSPGFWAWGTEEKNSPNCRGDRHLSREKKTGCYSIPITESSLIFTRQNEIPLYTVENVGWIGLSTNNECRSLSFFLCDNLFSINYRMNLTYNACKCTFTNYRLNDVITMIYIFVMSFNFFSHRASISAALSNASGFIDVRLWGNWKKKTVSSIGKAVKLADGEEE